MKVILATGQQDINDAIEALSEVDLVGTAASREDVIEMAENNQVDVIMLSASLPGGIDMLDLIDELRMTNTRIIYLSSNMDRKDPTTRLLTELGVEVLFGDSSIGQIRKKLINPDLADVDPENMADHHPKPEKPDRKREFVTKASKVASSVVKKRKTKAKKREVLDNVIAVWSPVSAGKTFVAVNLAAILGTNGYSTALVDFDFENFAVHSWLGLPPEDEAVMLALRGSLLEEDIWGYAYQTKNVSGLRVFAADPMLEKQVASEKEGAAFLEEVALGADVVIIDTNSKHDNPLTKTALQMAGKVIVVADTDYHHLLGIQLALNELAVDGVMNYANAVCVANKVVTIDDMIMSNMIENIERAVGLKVSHFIPEAGEEVLTSTIQGVPAVVLYPDIDVAFSRLAGLSQEVSRNE